MADNITIKDSTGSDVIVRTTDAASVHTKHVNVDASVLPTGAATAANQATAITAIGSVVTELQNAIAELQNINKHAQLSNFGSSLNAVDTTGGTDKPAINGASSAFTPVPTKKIVIDQASFFVAGTGVGSPGAVIAGDVVTVTLLEETSGIILARRTVTVTGPSTARLTDTFIQFASIAGLKLPTTGKRVMATVFVRDSGGSAVARILTGYLNIFYHEED